MYTLSVISRYFTVVQRQFDCDWLLARSVLLDRASYSYDSQGTREKFSDITGALLTNGNNTSFEGSLLHRQEQFILQPFPEFNRGRLDVSMTETAESVSYSSSQGKVVLDKATGTRTLF